MSGAATLRSTRRHRPVAWVWIVVALLVVAPVRGGNADASDLAGPHRTDHAHAGDAPAWSTADLASNRPDTSDRRHAPGGTLPGIVVCVLGALVVAVVARTRTIAAGKPLVAFRQRGPPRLQPVR